MFCSAINAQSVCGKHRHQTRKYKESRPRFNIFHSFSSGDAIFEGGWPLSVLPLPLSLSHRRDSLTYTLVCIDLHSPALQYAVQTCVFVLFDMLVAHVHHIFTDKKTAVCTERCVRLRRIHVRKSSNNQIHTGRLQLNSHLQRAALLGNSGRCCCGMLQCMNKQQIAYN